MADTTRWTKPPSARRRAMGILGGSGARRKAKSRGWTGWDTRGKGAGGSGGGATGGGGGRGQRGDERFRAGAEGTALIGVARTSRRVEERHEARGDEQG